MNQNQRALTMLRNVQTHTRKAVVSSLYNKLKLEDLDDFDSEIKQKLVDKFHPSKCLNRHVFNHFVHQAFIVNGILSDRDRFLHPTHQTNATKRDYIKHIQARYTGNQTPCLPSGEGDTSQYESYRMRNLPKLLPDVAKHTLGKAKHIILAD